jgi:tyrosyl-tRNA synthetase
MGGSDQWGNLTSGTDLIRKVEGESVHIMATPLITSSDGKKFGKSEGNAIWLDHELTSPYAFYQYWLNTTDADLEDRLKVFTFLTRTEIEAVTAEHQASPQLRLGQKRLALEVTSLVHSAQAAQQAIDASAALFGQGDLASLDTQTLESALAELPGTQAKPGTPITQLLVDTGLVASISAGRRAIAEGGVYLNNLKIDSEDAVLEGLLHSKFAVLRRGKKTLAAVIKSI